MVVKRPAAQPAECADIKRQAIDIKSVHANQSENECIKAIRCLGAAMPTQAKSGHPGAPIGCAPMAHALFAHAMRYDPSDPTFMGRDRFVLSNGHACSLLYTMLHLCTDHFSKDDLKNFRKLGSKTAGHPEAHINDAIEVTTGPLGQGLAQAVGIAIGQHQFNAKYGDIFDGRTYCIVGDGCLMEGIASEAASYAGTIGLGRLICLYDSNDITIDGHIDLAFSENVTKRFESYGWQVLKVEDGNEDLSSLLETIEQAKSNTDKPTMIVVNTTIGYKTILEGTAKVHGAPLPLDELVRFRKSLGQESEDIFEVSDELASYYQHVKVKNASFAAQWRSEYEALDEHIRNEIQGRFSFDPEPVIAALPRFTSSSKPQATRVISGDVLNVINPLMPGLCGGSADLAPSNMTQLDGEADFGPKNQTGKYLRFGVREHAMVAITNGLVAHGGFQPFAATFMIFYSYAIPAVRLAALSKFNPLFIATHDSIELGEDGPTHQPIELSVLFRAMPNILLFRPCDGNETSACYALWLRSKTRPVIASLSRGNVTHLDETCMTKAQQGAYILHDFTGTEDSKKIIMAGSGPEISLCIKSAELLGSEGYDVRVVSFPSYTLFIEQSAAYQESVLPKSIKHQSFMVEPLCGLGYEQYFNMDGSTLMNTFGASANKDALMDHFGFTAEKVTAKVKNALM